LRHAALGHHRHDHARHRLVELEHDVADEAVADDDIDRAAAAAAGENVAAFDVAGEVEVRRLEQLVRILDGGIALFRLFADAQQSHRGIGAIEDVFGVHGAYPCELHQFV